MDTSTTANYNEIKEAFDLVGKAQLGKINFKQLEILIKILGYNPQELEKSNQPEYSLTDVQNIVASMNHPSPNEFEEQFMTACRRYDPNSTGFITIPQIAKVLQEFGEDCSEEEFLETMRLGEHDYGDQIDYKNFCLQMLG